MTASSTLPTEADFDPWNGYPDAQCAWIHFGGLTLEQALSKFQESPDYYQEDFMFMGGRAFAYYYPVIDAYLRSIPDIESCDDHQACILAHGIKQQFESENLPHVRHLAPRVIELANFVTENSRRFGNDDEERRRVTDAWTALVRHLNAVTAP